VEIDLEIVIVVLLVDPPVVGIEIYEEVEEVGHHRRNFPVAVAQVVIQEEEGIAGTVLVPLYVVETVIVVINLDIENDLVNDLLKKERETGMAVIKVVKKVRVVEISLVVVVVVRVGRGVDLGHRVRQATTRKVDLLVGNNFSLLICLVEANLI
jgi:hypothetical protein